MITNTFTVRLVDGQPVTMTESPYDHEFDVHQDIVIKGNFQIGFDDRSNRAVPSLEINFPDETIESLKTLLNTEAVTLSASVVDNSIFVSISRS